MQEIKIFGELIPNELLEELKEEYPNEELTSEFLETLFWYEYQDNL